LGSGVVRPRFLKNGLEVNITFFWISFSWFQQVTNLLVLLIATVFPRLVDPEAASFGVVLLGLIETSLDVTTARAACGVPICLQVPTCDSAMHHHLLALIIFAIFIVQLSTNVGVHFKVRLLIFLDGGVKTFRPTECKR
jgi:hypothetical protein